VKPVPTVQPVTPVSTMHGMALVPVVTSWKMLEADDSPANPYSNGFMFPWRIPSFWLINATMPAKACAEKEVPPSVTKS
jgi:hypothetical protein